MGDADNSISWFPDNEQKPPFQRGTQDGLAKNRPVAVWPARLLIGVVVLICAEVFSGASLRLGLWHPWTLIVTFWLYFAHFFFFTTLAVRTRRTSLPSLYLWGVLFGLYESWITKVIWYGYGGDGEFVMGSIGPYGFSEISMVFLFHPVASFILPLAVTCIFCPSLRCLFPDLAWLTGTSRLSRLVQGYLIFSLAPVMAMNSGGPVNLLINVGAAVLCILVLWLWAGCAFESADGQAIIVFGGWGFAGLCAYLVLLYSATYVVLRPEGLPSLQVQLFTLVFYALAVVGLVFQRARQPLRETDCTVENRERQFVLRWFALLLILACALTPLAGSPVLYLPIVVNFAIWTPLGFILTAAAVTTGVSEHRAELRQ